MAIHRNNYFLACMDSDRLDRVISTFYSADSIIDYEEEKDDIWFITSSRHDRMGYMMTILLNHSQRFQSLQFLERLFGIESEYNQDYKEYCRLQKFDDAIMLQVVEDIDLIFNMILSIDLVVFEQLEGYSLDTDYIKNIKERVLSVEKEVIEKDLNSECDGLGDLFVLLKLIQQLFQKSVQNGMSVGYMSNSAG